MDKFCKYCGAELPDDGLVCPACGAAFGDTQDPIPTDSEMNSPLPEVPKKKKRKLWLIPVAVVLVLVIAAVFLWRPLFLKIAPRTYLSMAASKTMSAMSERNEGNPLELLKTADECLNQGTTEVELEYGTGLFGKTEMNISLASDAEAMKWAINMSGSSLGTELNADLYLDKKFLALRYDALTGSDYYGLTYDTFDQDLRSSALGAQLSDEEIDQYAAIVDQIDSGINQVTNYETLLEPYQKLLAQYIESVELTTGSASIELDGKQRKCETVSFEVDDIPELLIQVLDEMKQDETLQNLLMESFTLDTDTESTWEEQLEELQDVLDEMDEEGEATYYIYKGKLVAMGVDMEMEIEESEAFSQINLNFLLTFGTDPGESDVVAELKMDVDGEKVEVRCVSAVENTEETYKNTLTLTAAADDGSTLEGVYATQWKRGSGKLTFKANTTADGEESELDLSLKLLEKENGLKLVIDDFSALLGEVDEEDSEDIDCSLTIEFKKGCTIETPDYINLDQISEDVISSLFGDFGYMEDDWYGDDSWDDDYDYDDFDIGVTPKIVDEADLLTQAEEESLEQYAEDMVWIYEVDVVIATVNGTDSEEALSYAQSFYNSNGYGLGDDRSGVIFLLDTESWQCAVLPAGDCIEALPYDACLDVINKTNEDLTANSSYSSAFQVCLEQIEEYLFDYIYVSDEFDFGNYDEI